MPPKNATFAEKSSLETKLHVVLVSRDERWIRRRLPDPNTSSTMSLLTDFTSNDYLSLSNSSVHAAHAAVEARLADFFHAYPVLLFNSGFDTNVGFFCWVPQPGDVIVYDKYIHASVHDTSQSSRTAKYACFSFVHNSMPGLRRLFLRSRDERVGLRMGESSLFLSVESLYSMDGRFAPSRKTNEAQGGRGCVALLGLEDSVLPRLHIFGKVLAATGGRLLRVRV
ncbi:hypothetical protein M413DRAFT_20832 [Hebeloma cylindrosporum]|uniref:Uncharacterized protein n=1 Tax=Hebeloma cylindrosporum TaxID=76867 RepID=A0A0C2Y1L6_HEBCY|nr:hypothetical protein M413DRAFT_20832 [Hebeloma cylindrosporum h7]